MSELRTKSGAVLLTEPGVYDLTSAAYHRDPVEGGSLSSTGARRLLPPSCPAMFKHWQDNPQPPRTEFDLGHAVHADVLGVGQELVVIEAGGYQTKAAREARDEAYALGKTPLLLKEFEQTTAAANAVRNHPIAGPLMQRDGPVEQALVWRDTRTGVWLRAMLDKQVPDKRRFIAVDLKTTKRADLESISKSIANYGYHQQGAFYLDGIRRLGLAGDVEPAFVFVFVEITPPHLVTVVQLDPNALMWGDRLNRKAIDVYAHCTRTGVWPAYTTQVELVDLPYWTTKHLEDAHARGELDAGEAA